MRKTIATALTTALGVAGVLLAPTSYADEAQSPLPVAEQHPTPEVPAGTPTESLATAQRVLEGEARTDDPSATIALRDLWLARDTLSGQSRVRANAMLARPTDGAQDPVGFGYPDPSIATRTCNTRICVHYVPSGIDAPPSLDWVQHTLNTMDAVWSTEVDTMGYRAPVSDRGVGGTPQFDVYLKDLGGQLYGYCAPEFKGPRGRTASGYCVLDNNFSTAKFKGSPDGNLRVTAAHEFFHAVQFAYDYLEDRWMMESTATWIEELLADDVNDNRQYLGASQLYAPQLPLDTFVPRQAVQYGNWIFWEYLSERYGPNIVRKAWTASGQLKKNGGKYSFQALDKVLRRKGGFPTVYAKFAAGNLVPHVTYPEGSEYQIPAPRRTAQLTRKRRGKGYKARVHHMASASFRFLPDASLSNKKWKLRVRISGPHRRTKPRAVVLIHRHDGSVKQRVVKLNRRGKGKARLPFSARRVAGVSVTLVNASTRMRCNRRTYLACAGKPRDNGKRFRVNVRAVR